MLTVIILSGWMPTIWPMIYLWVTVIFLLSNLLNQYKILYLSTLKQKEHLV